MSTIHFDRRRRWRDDDRRDRGGSARLTDRQNWILAVAAQPLDPDKRITFQQRVAALLRHKILISDDDVADAAATVIRTLMTQPAA